MTRGLFVAFFLALCAVALAGDVVQLNSANFDQAVSSSDLVLVKFFAPWCGHCKSMKDDYEQAATELKGKALLAEVDATEDPELGQRFGVNGYPTIRLFVRGEVVADYQGARNAESFVKYMERASLPAVSQLESDDEIAAFKKNEGFRVLAAFDGDVQKNMYKSLAFRLRDEVEGIQFAECVGPARDSCGFDNAGIKVISDDEERKFDGDLDAPDAAEKLSAFIRLSTIPLVGEINQNTFRSYYEAGIPILVAFVDPTKTSEVDDIRSEMAKAAKETRGKINFCTADGMQLARQMGNLGLSGKLPGVAIDALDNKIHFALDESLPVNAETLGNFARDYVEGRLKWTPKSQDPAEFEPNDGPVKIITGKTFEEIVYDPTKNVLLEIYAPWCGHCKKLAPTWEKLGEALKGDSSIIIANIDATANDPPAEVVFNGFPTLKFFPAGENKSRAGIDYNGGRDYEDLLSFMKESVKASTKDEL
eukprot:TRINITY_DN2459_c0_g2::TRINITY_DN2459_c0_g2_i1::g.8740::m.8740 TRINITY_DN2459_c0_g2::TRINITY_DN2459_c0_g2_i1::g.8740  ORF type:complete len:492 (+),score=192.22,sp/P55059/PDI_HUMIN/37.23/4e-88,Thioredoxin/PF00085.15/1.5e-29,Thioredoxin/PF00085.15/8.6e+02,Thioredoxin/PF00085.15/9.4e-26,Thioredoxin_6/PF13848.1/0.00054,Thioredoxin_6/PF13848.1/3.9e-22,Thioredoxin_6/PF13848.1/2.2e+02,Thioredoxin_6/PF13848.1/8.5e+02,Thioredoxin_2/PF13098.1/1.8e-08,Thioredoxin_2/PF13098.1/2.9e+03,Thioredoxin_2/PF13098.1